MVRVRSMVAVVFVGLLVMGTLAFAQGSGGGRRGGPDGPIPALGLQLRGVDLTDAQRDQIREITTRYQEQLRSEVMLVLTPEQQEKVKTLQAERDARAKQRIEQRQRNRNQ